MECRSGEAAKPGDEPGDEPRAFTLGDERYAPLPALEPIRLFGAAGVRDERIVRPLNAGKAVTGAGLPWNIWRVRRVRAREGIERTAP